MASTDEQPGDEQVSAPRAGKGVAVLWARLTSSLHSAEDLTILHVVMAERPVGAGRPIPHNHLMWALIGVTHGSEENEFFRRSDRSIEPSGRGRVIGEGEVLMMGDDTIHSVKNPSSERLSSALHVYGGNLIAAEKTMWCDPSGNGEPFDLFRVIAS